MLTDDQRDTVERNLALAVTHARRIGGRHFDDLLSASFLGLVRAVQLYDPSHDVEFSSFAIMWMRRMTLRFRDSIPMVSLPSHVQYDYKRKSCVAFRQKHQVDIERAKGSRKFESRHLHFTPSQWPNVEEEAERREEIEILRGLISRLKGDEKKVFDLLIRGKGITEIARLTDVKRATASAIKVRVIDRFRRMMTKQENVA